MKIYCIVVYNSISARQEFYASVSKGNKITEPHLDTIQNNIRSVISMINAKEGMHTLTTSDQIYYACLLGDKLAITATDEALPPYCLNALFEKIMRANKAQDLEKLINNPAAALTQSKIELIKESLEETKEIMLENIEKVIARGENINELMMKTESLSRESFMFSKRSSDLKNKKSCPGLFSFFNTIREIFSNDTYDYDYEPLVQRKL